MPRWSRSGCCRPPASKRWTSPREDLTRAVTELFEALARRRPLVLIFEDVHWAEPPLLDLVEHLLAHIATPR